MAVSERLSIFKRRLQVLLTEEQDELLRTEVERRKKAGVVSDVETAHGGNPNVNKGVIIREMIEKTLQNSGG